MRWSKQQRVCAAACAGVMLLGGPTASAQTAAQHQGENGPAAAAPVQATVTYASDLLADVRGGARRGAMYDARLGLILDSDLGQAFGWAGATAHLSVHAIHGTGVSGDRVGNLLTVSGLEAEPTLRLFNLWVQQQLGRGASLRLGQFTAAQEFVLSPTANLFVNSTFGWPASFAVDLPSGGPAYPLAAPGARIAWTRANTTWLAAVFAGDPAGRGSGDPQRRDRLGLNGLRLAGRAFLIAEMQQRLGPAADAPVFKLGGWAHLDRFGDLRFDAQGRSLADPASSGGPRRRRGDTAVYTIVDGRLWGAGPRVLSGFVRAAASPSDRNRIDRYLDLGFSLAAPFAARPGDTIGVAAAVARVSPRTRALAADVNGFTSQALPLPRGEAVVEVSYQLQLGPNIFLQPDLQYVVRPNAGAADPATLRPLKDALVAGVRTSMRF